ncbi:hypothetical protein ACFQL0_14395 [Haloplanus litoreus]|uniref:hypothetical protein n=1 Tax=Haloplanus litoreus TaxID=767515 RepID=UPI0036213F6F
MGERVVPDLPQTFEHFELFFEADAVYAVFAEESFKSLLLRRDGRTREAREVGRRNRSAPSEQLLADERSFVVPTSALTAVRISPGSLFAKPTLTVETASSSHTLYHSSRDYDVDALRRSLANLYDDTTVDVAVESREWLDLFRSG